ncbi:MAG: hypothetical protein IT379_13405, partial [Deltaproteobacteria bacterium]|nr:hypothetical protein [Deltaproteobacteria bacterium]
TIATSRPRASLALLTQPAWWAALALLLLNDHVLKGAGLLPGFVTGKLSDLAGLVVAPVLLVAITRAQSTRARVLCFAAVASLFAAIKLSPACADALEGAMALVGLRWRIWVDPTDLVAFAVLPLAWRLVSGPRSLSSDGETANGSRYGAWVGQSGLVLGVLACFATSQIEEPYWTTQSFLVNRTDSTQLVGVRILLVGSQLDCDLVEADPERALSPSLFGATTTYRLDADSTLPLDYPIAIARLDDMRPDPNVAFTATTTPTSPECGAAIVSASGIEDTVVFWRRHEIETVQVDDYPDAIPTASTLELARGELRAGAALVAAPLRETIEAGTCVDSGPERSFSLGELPLGYDGLRVVDVAERDGCHFLRVEKRLTPGHPVEWTLCVPREAMPFVVGEAITVSGGEGEVRITGDDHALIIGVGQERIYGLEPDSLSGVPDREIASLERGDCTANRDECGAYFGDVDVVLFRQGVESRRIAAGNRATVALWGERTAELFVGHARWVAAAGPTCLAPTPRTGTRVDYAILE